MRMRQIVNTFAFTGLVVVDITTGGQARKEHKK